MGRKAKRPDTHGPRQRLLDDAALFASITSISALTAAWSKVWANGGAAGGDGVSVQRFSINVMARLARLRREARGGSYRPGPLRAVDIPKASGRGLRRLSIPCVADRVLQTAAATGLTPLLDEEFEPSSFGYRPGRSVQQAVARIMLARREGFGWVVDADIEDYFDSIPHAGLMERWAQSVSPGPLTELVSVWLTHAAPRGRGVPQGSPISPLLANLFLDRLDEALWARGMRLVRFADDFVILCRSRDSAGAAMDKARRELARHGLRLNRDKSRVTSFEQGFRFLGHLFVRSMALKTAPEQADASEAERLLREVARRDARDEQRGKEEQSRIARAEARGYSPGFRVLHLQSADRRLDIRNQAFCVQQASGGPGEETRWSEIIAIPHQDVDRIDIGPRAGFTARALRHALATGTLTAFVNGHGQTLGWLAQPLAPRAGRHLAQAKVALDEQGRLDLARRFVIGKLRNQRTVLRRLLAGREGRPKAVLDALVTLNRLIGRGQTSRVLQARAIDQLMGYEGQAGAAWWRAINALAHEDFRMPGGARRRASRAAICLDFLSWLLQRDIAAAVERAGLHPGFGVLHASADGRDGCVYDLMEEFRAHFIGSLFVYVSNRRIIRPKMFEGTGESARMRPPGAEALIRAYEQRCELLHKSPLSGRRISWRLLMEEQAAAIAAHVEGRRAYSPHEL